MDFRDSPEDAAFRREVQDFLKTQLPADMRAEDDAILGVGVGEDERERDWLRTLAKRGWVESIEPGSPELELRRLSFVREQAVPAIAAALGLTSTEVTRALPVLSK